MCPFAILLSPITQVDFNLPQRFNMTYIGADGTKQQPIMIHRAIFGSIERFFGILTENYAGHFPLWLAPTQIRILPVTDHQVLKCTLRSFSFHPGRLCQA